METPKAAAVSLYKFAIRSTIGDNYSPECTHYLPLFMIDGDGNPTPVIATLGPPAGQAASHSGDTMFVVKNEFGVKTQHSCGGVHAYVSPQNHDLCPEESAYYPKGAHVKALMFNKNWIQVHGKKDVPADIKMRQAAQFAHAIPYWQQYGQQLQLTRDANEAAQPRPQLAIQDGSPRSQTPLYTSSPSGAPEVRGPDGLAMQVVASTARSEPATTESYAIATPRASPQQPNTGRSMISLPWRSISCSRRQPTKREGSCFSTPPGATDVAANTAPLHRFTFGGLEPRPGPDIPLLWLVIRIRTEAPRPAGTRFWMLETRV